MSLGQFSFSQAPVKRVKRVQFGVIGPDELKSMSVAHITKAESRGGLGDPVEGTLDDPRLGSIDDRGPDANDDPGYFGHVELASPVYHPGFIGELYKIIQCVCIQTSVLKIDKAAPAFKEIMRIPRGKKRLHALHKVARVPSRWQGILQPRFRKDGMRIEIEYPEGSEAELQGIGDRKAELRPAQALEILRNIPDEDCYCLGLDPTQTRPEWLVQTVVPISPPHVRPAVSLDALSRAHDDLTHAYANVIKANVHLAGAKQRGLARPVIEELEDQLQYACSVIVDNELPGQPQAKQRSGRVLKTIRQRLVGKAGRVRGNLMGKRVDFSARTVITADPTLSIHQVGVPRSVACTLTVPVRVSRYNMRFLQYLVERGPDNHPGAKYIIKEDGRRIDLRYAPAAEKKLRHGWTVERQMMDDDVVLFNRQPSLHKMSIMCHRAKVLDFSTFRLNLTCTTPYNADFDGDEMNLHILQTLPAQAEAAELMQVPKMIVSPQGNRPVMGIVQDTLLGANKMARRDCFFHKDMVMSMMMWIRDWNGRLPRPAVMVPDKQRPGRYQALWTGKQLVSQFMPNVNLRKGDDASERAAAYPKDKTLWIDRGELLVGTLNKGNLGPKEGGIIHALANDTTPDQTRDFINTLQTTINYWLMNRGFTVGIGDGEASRPTMVKISDSIEKAKKDVANLVIKAQEGDLPLKPGQSMFQTFEMLVNQVLNSVRSSAGSATTQSFNSENNNIMGMMISGSKGSEANISQIIACVGQQNVEGKRIAYGFSRRTLPHFCKDDLGTLAKGFVENSYIKGLKPFEFYFHMMGGREGLIDTACKTAETGYIQRRLVKALEDLKVEYDGTVRNAEGCVVQFLYGEDGMDGRWIERQELSTYPMSEGDVRAEYGWDLESETLGVQDGHAYMDEAIVASLQSDSEAEEALEEEVEQLVVDRAVMHQALRAAQKVTEPKRHLPVPVDRLILNAQRINHIDPATTISDLNPVEVVRRVRLLNESNVVVRGTDSLAVEAQTNATALLQAHLRSQLASKVIIKKHRLTRVAFDWLIGEVSRRFNRALAVGGEMCGVLAAQSMGEPATQMTLNTFHSAGISAKNVTLGVPRLKELINVAKRIKTPCMTIFVQEHLRNDADAYHKLQAGIECNMLDSLVESSEIIFDKDPRTTVVDSDREFVELDASLAEDVNFDALMPWVLRLKLSWTNLTRKGVKLTMIRDAIQAASPDVHICFSDENDPEPVMRVRLMQDEGGAGTALEQVARTREDVEALQELEQLLLHDMELRGITHIRKLYTRTSDEKHRWDPALGLVKVSKPETIIDTDGTNLVEILAHPDVDPRRTTTNDVIEILEVLGIEACRASLFHELFRVISFDGTYVNYRHLAMLVEAMTFRGYLCAITRHGINRVDTGPISRASFEETVELLMDAAVFSESDAMRGVSQNVLFGQMALCGTGVFDCYLDGDLLDQHAITGYGLAALDAGVDAAAAAGVSVTPMLASAAGYGEGTPMTSGADTASLTAAGTVYGEAEFSPEGGGRTAGGITPGGLTPGGLTPSTSYGGMASPDVGAVTPGFASSPSYSAASPHSGAYGAGSQSPLYTGQSPAYTGQSPAYTGQSPAYQASSPAFHATSPGAGGGGYSPTSPAYSPSAGGADGGYSPTSPGVTPSGTGYSPTSPGYSPTSPATTGGRGGGYSPTSPGAGGGYSPTSPGYSPTSPGMAAGGGGGGGGGYSPTSPAYSPSAGGGGGGGGSSSSGGYSPTSPAYSPSAAGGGVGGSSSSSGGYSPTSPAYSPSGAGTATGGGGSSSSGGGYSPTSPAYSPSAAGTATGGGGAGGMSYSPTSPAYSPSAAGTATGGSGGGVASYSPTSPAYSPSAAASSTSGGVGGTASYSPTSPAYSPSAAGTAASGTNNANSGGTSYSPTSPAYSPS